MQLGAMDAIGIPYIFAQNVNEMRQWEQSELSVDRC